MNKEEKEEKRKRKEKKKREKNEHSEPKAVDYATRNGTYLTSQCSKWDLPKVKDVSRDRAGWRWLEGRKGSGS